MRILMAGASGFLGTALRTHLTAEGHEVTQLVRSATTAPDQDRWDPVHHRLDPDAVAACDVVINLAGAPIAHWPVTSAYKATILDSRLSTTGLIAETIAGLDDPPALINASGISFYGDRGDESLDEDSSPGDTFLAGVAQRWEAATEPARAAGARVVSLRTAVVLDGEAGALKLMRLPFRLGAGGRLGSGTQWFPTISLIDYVAAVTRLTTDDTLSGPVNLVAPVPATNAEFTRALGAELGRPTLLPVPAFVLEILAGDLSSELLGSLKAAPRRLLDAGFTFRQPTIALQLSAALSRS